LSKRSPSTSSTAVSIDFDSSTVITPSWPTRSMAVARISPICTSPLAAIVATCWISSRPLTFLAMALSSATTASTHLSRPRLSTVGFTPEFR
jgi:hypothetical protein